MEIAFLEPHLKLVGGIRRIVEVANRLISYGHSVSIFTPTGTPCRWLKCAAPVFNQVELHKRSFDVLIFNLAEQYPVAVSANAKKKVFWVLAPEALYKNPMIPIRALKQPGLFFMANSAFTAGYINQHVKVSYEIPIIPGGINREHFKHDHSIPKRFSVLYYGSARPWKGTSLIEGAVAVLRVSACKLEGAGIPQEKMWETYNSCEVAVVANQVEGFSFVELEAMACGTPVVCTDSGGNREYVKDGINAIVVPRTIAGLVQGVKRVLSDKVLRKALRNQGLNTAADPRYTWDAVGKQVEAALLGFIS